MVSVKLKHSRTSRLSLLKSSSAPRVLLGGANSGVSKSILIGEMRSLVLLYELSQQSSTSILARISLTLTLHRNGTPSSIIPLLANFRPRHSVTTSQLTRATTQIFILTTQYILISTNPLSVYLPPDKTFVFDASLFTSV